MHWYGMRMMKKSVICLVNVLFVIQRGLYLFCTNTKETHTSWVCLQYANTRSGRMFGRLSEHLVTVKIIQRRDVMIYQSWRRFLTRKRFEAVLKAKVGGLFRGSKAVGE